MTDQDQQTKELIKKPIPEQVYNGGQEVQLDLAEYFNVSLGEPFEFTIDYFPPELHIEPITGLLTGVMPDVETDTPYLVSVTVKNSQTGKFATQFFPITILGRQSLGASEEKGLITRNLEDVSFWEAAHEWEIMRFLQYYISQHFACVALFSGKTAPERWGKWLSNRKAQSGWTIFNFENIIIVTTGELAFAEYGNRARLLETIREIFDVDVRQREWSSIGIEGSDSDTINKVWIIGQLMGMPVNEIAPSHAAEFNLRNLVKIVGDKFQRPRPGHSSV